MQKKILARFARQLYLTILSKLTQLKILENNTCTYILPLFSMAATVATGEGKFDMKMQDF